ncbi:hypothetical protein FRB93_004839 [Tulasnella sp. JGI-2019a]|nr:hypothetical protein FRB93_004839 [Tulasnella sp. JGI-2019a]
MYTPNYHTGDSELATALGAAVAFRPSSSGNQIGAAAVGTASASVTICSVPTTTTSSSTSYQHQQTASNAFPSDLQQNSNNNSVSPPVISEFKSATTTVMTTGLDGSDWSLPLALPMSSATTAKDITNVDAASSYEPFAYTTTLAPSFDLTNFSGLLFGGGVVPAPPALYGTTRRWSLTDPHIAPSMNVSASASSSQFNHMPYQQQQRPWTSIASGGSFGSGGGHAHGTGTIMMSGSGLGGGGIGGSSGFGHGGASLQPSTLAPSASSSHVPSSDPSDAHHGSTTNADITTPDSTCTSSNANSNSLYRTYSDETSPMAPSFSSSSSRPSTSSSFSSAQPSIGTPQGETFFLSGTGAAGAAFQGVDPMGMKRRTSSSGGPTTGGASAFYGLGLEGGHESTDTICLPPTSSHGQQQHHHHHHHHHSVLPASAPPTASSSIFNHQQQQQQQLTDDSNPFYFARELQLLQAQSHRQYDATSLPHTTQRPQLGQAQIHSRPNSGYLDPHAHRPNSGYIEPLRPTSGYLEPQQQQHQQQQRPSSGYLEPHVIHPSLQTAIASTSPDGQYLFFEREQQQQHDQQHQLLTPPSTAGSSYHFDPSVSLPRPPRTAGADSFTLSPYRSHTTMHNGMSSYEVNGYGDSPPSTSATTFSHTQYSVGAGQFRRHSTSSMNNGGNPSPYSLIIQNPDPSTATSRPHLCTHCNETFRRIHDAKRHAFGALGIKNYACMGGCGMTFKRSEGRARHWMREEVVGVGVQIEVGEFFSRNPGLVGVGGEVKVAGMVIGGKESLGGKGKEVMLWGGKGCEERHAKMMSGTMEEDRRLRNKARRERIKTIEAKDKKGGVARTTSIDEEGGSRPNTSNGFELSDGGHQSNSESPQPRVPMTLGQPPLQTSPSSRPYSSGGGGVGPVRHFRSSHAVAPY